VGLRIPPALAAAPPHRGLARETVVLRVDGLEQPVEVVRQNRFLGGTQAYWRCPRCAVLARTYTCAIARLRAAVAISSIIGVGMSRVLWLARLSCAAGSALGLAC
jgi:hypothetical protein